MIVHLSCFQVCFLQLKTYTTNYNCLQFRTKLKRKSEFHTVLYNYLWLFNTTLTPHYRHCFFFFFTRFPWKINIGGEVETNNHIKFNLKNHFIHYLFRLDKCVIYTVLIKSCTWTILAVLRLEHLISCCSLTRP